MDSKLDLDKVLDSLGHFGKFQKRNYFFICIIVAYTVWPLGYIFTTRNSKYRCLIEECENADDGKYEADWLNFAIPKKENEFDQCHRYKSLNISGSQNVCSKNQFSDEEIKRCDEFVYEDGDLTIERDFNIHCDENLWKLTIVGTINNIGELACLPISGLVSDRYGRRTMMVISVLLSALCGMIKSFSPSYIFFVIMEVLETAIGSGSYSAAYILAIELVVPEKRVLGNTLLACAFAIGEGILGLVAWISPSWRTMLRILYAPGILFIFYYKCTNESVRWLLSKGDRDAAGEILRKVARTNGAEISTDLIEKLTEGEKETSETEGSGFGDVVRSGVMMARLMNCSFAWVCCTFVYYGLTMHSVSISGNLYVNFITVALIEMPAYLLSYCTLDRIGRKISLSFSLLVSGIACIAFLFIPEGETNIHLVLFLIGKFSATIAYTTLYIYTTEMFPTNLRHSLLAVCSMFGRLGSMVAPQIPLLARISKSLPVTLFGVIALASGLLSLLFPETLNTKLPDTIHEAVHVDSKSNARYI